MSPNVLRLAIISDIHAASSAQAHAAGSYVLVPARTGRKNPLDDLKSWIREAQLPPVDYLVCPGDISNQADAEAFTWMWGEMRELADLLSAKEVHATCGNHDLDSRYLEQRSVDDPDAKGALLALYDRFPALSIEEHNHFWARNFVILDRSSPFPHRILLVNTCAYHGGKEEEIKHGRISSRTIADIVRNLKARNKCGLNVMVCHHHLHPLPAWDSHGGSDYQYVRKGGELVRALEEVNVGPWLVVHGHRHWPDCIYAAGGAGSPVIFCAGSFGKQEAQVTNQFHIIELTADSLAPKPMGTISTWSWSLSRGWQPAEKADRSLTYKTGFGFQGGLGLLVDQIANNVPEGDSYMEWSELVDKIPDLNHLLPNDFARLEEDLRPQKIRIFVDRGQPVHVGRRAKR